MADMAGLMSMIQQGAASSSQASMIGMQSSLMQGEMAVQLAQLEAEGLQAQLELNQVSSAANVKTDLEGMAMKQALLMSSKSLETAMLVAQYREKTLGLFNTIAEQRTNNVWTRIKTISQGFKF